MTLIAPLHRAQTNTSILKTRLSIAAQSSREGRAFPRGAVWGLASEPPTSQVGVGSGQTKAVTAARRLAAGPKTPASDLIAADLIRTRRRKREAVRPRRRRRRAKDLIDRGRASDYRRKPAGLMPAVVGFE